MRVRDVASVPARARCGVCDNLITPPFAFTFTWTPRALAAFCMKHMRWATEQVHMDLAAKGMAT